MTRQTTTALRLREDWVLISYRAMKTDEWPNADRYQVACDCGNPSCNLVVEVEYDKRLNMTFVNFYQQLKWSAYWNCDDKWHKEWWSRIKGAWKMLWKGYIEVEESFVIQGPDHISSFVEVLQECERRMKEWTEDVRSESN